MKIVSHAMSTVLLSILYSQPAFSVTFINSLPFDCDIAGETYVVTADLTLGSGNAITIAADNVIIDGNGKTITYANSGPGYGIFINETVSSLDISGLTLTKGAYNLGDSELAHAIYRQGDYAGLTIHDNTIVLDLSAGAPTGYGHGIRLGGGDGIDSEIAHNSITIIGSGETGGATGISVAGDTFAGEIHHNDITLSGMKRNEAGYPRGIELSTAGNANSVIHNNTIDADFSNDSIQGIGLWRSDGHVIRDNFITSAATHSRMILIDGDSDFNQVFNNFITMTDTGSDDASSGIVIRFGSDNNIVYGNTIDGSDADKAYALRLGGSQLSSGLPQPVSNIIHNNILKSSSRTVSIEKGSNFDFYENEITAFGGQAVYFQSTNDSEIPANIAFSLDTINGAIQFVGPQASNILFCGTNVTGSQIELASGNYDYTIANTNCPHASDRPTKPRLTID